MKSSYRVETKWKHSSWRYVPEHGDLTLKRANEVVSEDKEYEREGMKQRIVVTTQKVLRVSKSRLYSPEQLAWVRNMRGY